MMNTIKKYLGLVWIIIAIGAIVLLIKTALENIQADGKLEINQPMPWIIIISIFTPIAIGMALFGYYALKDEYKLDD
jgi:hypothetical protein